MLRTYEDLALSNKCLPFSKEDYQEIVDLIEKLRDNIGVASNNRFVTWEDANTLKIMLKHTESKQIFEL